MVRRWLLTTVLLCVGACTSRPVGRDDPGLLLRGFELVDPEARTLRRADLVIEGNRVVAAPSSRFRHRTVDGRGRFLLPAFWDMKASLWGNASARYWRDVFQELGITRSLRVQLAYGVAHVVCVHEDWPALEREARRAAAFELDAAELLYADKPLCGPGGKSSACHHVKTENQAAGRVAELIEQGVSHVLVAYGDPGSAVLPPVSRPVLERVLDEARRRGLQSYVLVDTWAKAEEAVASGAAALHGLPAGALTDALVGKLVDRGVAYAPALGGTLELARLLGRPPALRDPWLARSVPRTVLETFEREADLWDPWRPVVATARTRRDQALRDLSRLATAGVPILSATDAGWMAGAFQGYSTFAVQGWLERAGLDPWSRLRAATTGPARFLGRRIGFSPGDPADFVVLREDPSRSARSLQTIEFVVREGRYVVPANLLPDVTRSAFRP